MKKVCLISILCASAVASTIVISAAENNNFFQVRQILEFSRADLSFGTRMGYDRIDLRDCQYLNADGRPMLPSKIIKVALPNGMVATGVKIVETRQAVVEGSYDIYPTQPPRRISAPSAAEFIDPDSEVYASSQPYPAELVELVRQTDLAGQGMAVLRVNPLRYVATEKRLILYTSIAFIIDGTSGYECGDYLPPRASDGDVRRHTRILQQLVINPEDVQVRRDPRPVAAKGVDPGDYDYVIITPSSWGGDFQPLADWKTKKGLATKIVSTEWIYASGGYPGPEDEDKIQQFVANASAAWGAEYFLLGGDFEYIPCHFWTQADTIPPAKDTMNVIPNDTYYADHDTDFVCEVHVGRASVGDTAEINIFIDKTLTYEKDPPLTDYAKKAALFGFDLDNGTRAENCKITIDGFIPADWTLSNIYDSHAGNHEADVKTAINAGQNLLNHCDHANQDVMGVGHVQHSTDLDIPEVDAFVNADRQSIQYSIGCWANAYDFDDCIAEHFVKNPNGGCVAFVGNSRFGWYNPGMTNTLSMLYDINFFNSLFSQGHHVLGECFTDHKNDSPTTDEIEKYVFAELTLMGDPALPIWTQDPSVLTVTHPSTLPTGPSTFLVHVQEDGGPSSGALVCLWKGDEVYVTDHTDASGDASFSPSPTTTGTMFVTVTKHNYLPYEGTAEAAAGGPPPVTDLGIALSRADVVLTWSPPEAESIARYVVYRDTLSDFEPEPEDSIGRTADTSYTDPAAAGMAGTNYYYVIRAVSDAGAKSEPSNCVGEFDVDLMNGSAAK